MKTQIQYLNDSDGKIQSVLLPFTEWEKVQSKLRKYEQMIRMTSDLTEAFEEVEKLKNSKAKKQTLNEFLNEL